ncbi:hypothetical protein B0H14DRAFT_3469616 [Mycena olivaceomarginata]|nr:hypothetical protein B0H14DRAFT_3469616 [Mycena olivaceomarginata]
MFVSSSACSLSFLRLPLLSRSRIIRHRPLCGSQIIRTILFSTHACQNTPITAHGSFISPSGGKEALSESQTNPAVLEVVSMIK